MLVATVLPAGVRGIVVAGLFLPRHGEIVLMTGLFALSGGVTNWLAVHMLFERVPLLYGSGALGGVIEILTKSRRASHGSLLTEVGEGSMESHRLTAREREHFREWAGRSAGLTSLRGFVAR